MRHNPSTVVILAGQTSRELTTAIGQSMNVVLVEAADQELSSASDALRRAARVSSPYVLVHGDPLAAMAAQWQAMWDVSRPSPDTAGFEVRASEILAAWRAGQFELPDYYLVVADRDTGDAPPDFHLGPLRAARPNRVAVAVASEPREQAAEVLKVLGSLRHGPWWPPLEEIVETARSFYPGSLTGAGIVLSRRASAAIAALALRDVLATPGRVRQRGPRSRGASADRGAGVWVEEVQA